MAAAGNDGRLPSHFDDIYDYIYGESLNDFD
jgi:hypothetical protein